MDASRLPFRGDVLQCASAYLEAGLSVIPIRPGDKKPLIDWAEFQTRRATADEIEQWSSTWPDMNLAVVTGEVSGVTVVDLDGDAGRDSAASIPDWPSTLTQKSPHGSHCFFAHEPGVRNAAGILPGVDIRGEGGYVLVFPSALSDGGTYAWVRRVPLAPYPAAMLPGKATASVADAIVDNAPGWVTAALVNGAGQGARNQTAARLAGYFVARGLPEDILLQVLHPFAKACDPPFSRVELADTIHSVMRYRAKAMAAGIIDPPTRVRTRMGERFVWDEIGVSIELRGIRPDGDSYVAEMTVDAMIPGVPARIHGPTRFNLMSTQVRSQVSKYLAERLQLNWAELLETVGRLAIEGVREGEPTILLRDAPRAETGMYAIEPLVLSTSPTIWFSDGGVGKSLLALAACCAMTGHGHLVGMTADRLYRVAYLDWEWEPAVHKQRMLQMLGSAAAESPILYRRMTAPLHDQVEQLLLMIEEHGIDFVVIDSAGMACGDDPETSKTAIRFANAVRQLNVGSLWLTHITKNGSTDHPFGSVYWHNTARSTWYLARDDSAGPGASVIGFFNKKSNSDGLHKPLGFALTFDGGRIFIEPQLLGDVPVLARKLTLRDQILGALRHGPLTLGDLSERIDAPKSSVKARLTEMRAGGQVGLEDGLWMVANVEDYRDASPPDAAPAWSPMAASVPTELDW